MSTKYYQLKVTEKELLAIMSIIDTADGMIGCADVDNEGDLSADSEARIGIKAFDKMMKRNGLTR